MTVILITVIEVCDDGSAVMEAELLALSVTVIFTPVSEVIKVVIKTNRKRQEEVTIVNAG